MIISGKIEEKEDEKVKAYINLDINGFQLRGFKLYEDEDKKIRLLNPSIMVKDEEGNYKMGKDNKPINRHPITINQELSNAGELYKKLEVVLVDTYKEFKEKGLSQINKEVEAKEFEKGELNITTYNISKTKGNTQNPDINMKSNHSVFIGAFKINDVNLFYNAQKNDFTFSCPSYESAKNGKQEFIVPKTQESYKKLKDKLVSGYKEQDKKFKNDLKEQKMQQEQKNLKVSATQSNEKPVESQAPKMQ